MAEMQKKLLHCEEIEAKRAEENAKRAAAQRAALAEKVRITK